jgi:titin
MGTLLVAAPKDAVAAPAAGPGTMTVSPSVVLASSTDNKLTFTYSAAAAGVSRGTVKFVVPTGWTAPQKKKAQLPGFVSASKGKVVVSKSSVSIKKLTVCGGCLFTITYSDATAPATGKISTFVTSAAAKGRKLGALASQPTVTVATLPTAPGITSVTPGDGQLTFQLTAASGFPAMTSYTVTCESESTTIDNLTVTVTGLTDGTQYSCLAVATNAAGNGPPSTSATGTPGSQVPAAPIWLSAPPGSESLTINFGAPASPEPIISYTATCISPSQVSTSTTVSSPAASVTVTGLTDGTHYNCTLYATDAAGNGPNLKWNGTPTSGGGL